MIENFGIGIDIADIDGFRNILFEKKTSFYKKIIVKSLLLSKTNYQTSTSKTSGTKPFLLTKTN